MILGSDPSHHNRSSFQRPSPREAFGEEDDFVVAFGDPYLNDLFVENTPEVPICCRNCIMVLINVERPISQ